MANWQDLMNAKRETDAMINGADSAYAAIALAIREASMRLEVTIREVAERLGGNNERGSNSGT
jgi:flagellar hook-basal body complex protein FliE